MSYIIPPADWNYPPAKIKEITKELRRSLSEIGTLRLQASDLENFNALRDSIERFDEARKNDKKLKMKNYVAQPRIAKLLHYCRYKIACKKKRKKRMKIYI